MSLCEGGSQAAAPGAIPADEAVLVAAVGIERRVQEARSAGALILDAPELEIAALGAGAKASAAMLARYCNAAAELSLLTETGSQQQTRTLLLGALEYSKQAKLPALTGRIAYRLGLTSAGGMPLRAVRGAGGVRRTGPDVVSQLRRAAATGEGPAESCTMLSTIGQGADSRGVALLALDCAARTASSAGDHLTATIAGLRFANGANELIRSFDEAETLRGLARLRVAESLGSAARISDPEQKAELLDRLANLALDLDLSRPVIDEALSNLTAAATTDPGRLASIAKLRGRLALKANQRGVAHEFIETAIFHESRRAIPYRLPALYVLLAEADPQRRSAHVAAAYAALQNLRPKIPRFDPLTEESMFSLHMRSVFEAAAAVQLEAATDDAGLNAAQRIVEDFREAELQSALGNECLPTRAPLQASDLAAGESLLYPLVFGDRLELIFVTNDGSADMRFVRLPANANATVEQVTRLAERLTVAINSGDAGVWREPARQLYDLLIKPIEARLGRQGSLAIIPDRALRGVPFAMLMAADGQFLVEKTAISVAPALAYSQPGDSMGGSDVSIVAASLEREVSLLGTSFPALEGTGTEAREAAGHGSPGQWIADFTRAQLRNALAKGPVDVLHLATHASFNGRSDKAFIVASDGLIPLAELRDMISKSSIRDGLIDLLVLSACETAVGDDESSMGLAGAAISAGSVSAIASLWPVDDAGATELMRTFYAKYRSGKSRAQALREAQVALLSSKGDKADPFVWAAFTLVGAWR